MPGITDPTEAYFKDGQWGWDGTQWRKLGLLWGFSEHYFENLGGTKDGDGTYETSSTAIPADYIYVVQCVLICNENAARGMARIALRPANEFHAIAYKLTPARYEPTVWEGAIALHEGDQVSVQQLSCINGDVLRASIWGYKMKIAE